MNKPRIGIWHPGLSSNYGDRAIQRATVDLVLDRWPSAQIVQYHNDSLAGSIAYPDPRIVFEPLGPLGLPPLGRRLADLDLLLWGGGSLIQQSSLLHFPLHLLPAASAARRGVKVVCFGSGVEPLRSGLLRALARKAFRSVFDGAFVRGPLSAQLLESYGVDGPVAFAVDQAAALKPGELDVAGNRLAEMFGGVVDGPVVSVSVKPAFIYRGGILPVSLDPPSPARSKRLRRRASFEEAFGDLVRYLVDTVGTRVVILPMYLGQGDLDVCVRVGDLANRPEQVRVLDEPPPPRQLKALLSLMAVHVGVRLHSCILATSAGVPTLGVDYMTKHRDYFTMLDMTDCLIAEDQVTTKRLIDGFDRIWSDRSRIRNQLVAKNAELVADLNEKVDDMIGRLEQESAI